MDTRSQASYSKPRELLPHSGRPTLSTSGGGQSPFEERFALLVESGQATDRTVAAARLALDMIEKHYGIQLTDELGAPLATHLAITMKRLLNGETLSEAPDAVWEELQNHAEELEMASSIVSRLERYLNIPISRAELGFIAIHLARIKLEANLEARTCI